MSDKEQAENPRLKRIVVYLSVDTDQELIAHFGRYIKDRRVSDEARRLWYKALAMEGMKGK